MDEEVAASESRKETTEVAPALIAVHPDGHHVAVAVGPDLRVFNFLSNSAVSLLDESVNQPFHKDNIRAIRFGAKGKLFVSAGDDKTLKIWSPENWKCISTVLSEKRVTAVAISNDGLYVCFADKFGLVWIVDLNKNSHDKKPIPLLSHYCSIITSLEFSPDNRYILSADRDFKIRVTNFPKNPLNGAHEIQSFCLGHTEFVSCLAFVPAQENPHSLLLSGSGDSTVRLWDITSGALLYTCEVAIKAGLLESNGNAEEHDHAVTDLCTTLDGLLVAVAIQSLQGIVLLSCNVSAQTLSVAKVVSIAGENFVPTCLANNPSTRELWMVTGVSSLPGYDYPSLSRVLVISGVDVEQEPVVLGDDKIPGGIKLLETLQGTASFDDNAFLVAAEAVKAAMCNLLIKKQYPFENREYRKKTRNDRKLKE
ncbi:putative transcription factor WD40-like family [Medicago truncatula]|uniref:tRNA (guanine-N(7)-)-methyltransferase non-catalytic subunit n=1 Tax=Medicago truncatula TaxID=3880 RepID=A0A072UD69_MEDTR|nr:tRNA (guanine-N(7)-)-methyltransferase non-catalytic subunit wdr4 [Medicago truncatula]KEH23785.1 tRNA (guanine-N(7))-methyltransferase subunit WDR4 [Medicago truncatula]RHN48092.1 putative transcription factor WD40-like family [Medicago truncatula]